MTDRVKHSETTSTGVSSPGSVASQFDASLYDAFLFDLDGVVTPTVDLHRRAWQETFDAFFASVGERPYREQDYFEYLDGKPRFAGVASLLASRGINLPEGSGDHELGTIRGLGNEKNRVFREVLERDGIEPYPGTMLLIEALMKRNASLAIVSSSRNAEPVLEAAGVRRLFPVVVDGVVAATQGLPGKPAPDTFLYAADQLRVPPSRGVVFEDASSGVAAGRAGAFGLVVGVDRGAGQSALRQAGAHIVVEDLEELV